MKEYWKPIPEYEDKYLASTLGRIKSLPNISRNKTIILKPALKKSGYLNIGLCKNGLVKHYRVHRLIASTFIPNADKTLEVNHKNGIKNDNRLCNLEWVNKSDNCKHAYRVLGHKSSGGVAKKKIKCVEDNKIYNSLHDLERQTGVKRQTIAYAIKHSGVYNKKHWQFI